MGTAVLNRIHHTNGKKTIHPRLEELDVTKEFNGTVIISPESARRMLPLNIGNRRVRNGFIVNLREQIKAGEWQEDHPQPIVFSDAGRLIDGQHRLLAIIESELEVIANVVCGARDKLREYIDTGISRRLEDRVSFSADLKVNQACAQIINAFFMLVRVGGAGPTKPSPDQAWNIFQQRKEAILYAAEIMASRKQKGVTRAPVMATIAEFFEIDRGLAQEFTNGVMRDSCDIQQATMLRLYLLRSGGNGGQSQNLEIRGKCICAMKAFMEGREVRTLRMADW